MEMHEITTAEGEKKEDEAETASELMVETKTEDKRNLIKKEEAERDQYSVLQNPAEDVYSEAFYSGAPAKIKAGNQTEGNARLYRAGCIFLTIICLVLLLVVIILSVKLQTGSTVCPQAAQPRERQESPAVVPKCIVQQCQESFNIQPQNLGCRQCADGWLTLGRSCFYLSKFRLNWAESQRNCSARGGSLAVVSSPTIQNFLTQRGKMSYWIGLKHNGAAWTWVNNTVLTESYWAEVPPAEGCGLLTGRSPPEQNWVTAACDAYSFFICQLHM